MAYDGCEPNTYVQGTRPYPAAQLPMTVADFKSDSWARRNKKLSRICDPLQYIDAFFDDPEACNEHSYGYSMTGSLWSKEHRFWNVDRLGNAIDLTIDPARFEDTMVSGVNYPSMLFVGDTSCFEIHDEDESLPAVCFLHEGASKLWCVIRPSSTQRCMEVLLANYRGHDGQGTRCSYPLAHKSWLPSPQFLLRHGIEFTWVCYPY